LARFVNPRHGRGTICPEGAGGPSESKSSPAVVGCGSPGPRPTLEKPPGALPALSNRFTTQSRRSIMLVTATARRFSPARRLREPAIESPPHRSCGRCHAHQRSIPSWGAGEDCTSTLMYPRIAGPTLRGRPRDVTECHPHTTCPRPCNRATPLGRQPLTVHPAQARRTSSDPLAELAGTH
jgi:hypothetical protein